MIELRHITKAFNGVPAVRDASFAVAAGEIVALLGQNGAGKSTLMNVLSGVLAPDSGEIVVKGAPIQLKSPGDAEAHGIGIVHQELSVVPHLSVAANISLGREVHRRGGLRRDDEIERRAREALALVGSHVSPNRLMGSLPVSDQQLCEIARVAIGDVSIVVFDEPTTALSEEERERLFVVMNSMRDRGYAVVFVTHYLDDALRMSDRCVIMRDGQVVADEPSAGLTERDIVTLMINKETALDATPRERRTSGQVVLKVDGLTGPRVAPARLEVRAGEVVGLSGLLGSGRTELLRLIIGADRRADGSVDVGGVELNGASPRAAVEAGIVMVSEDRRIDGLLLDQSIEHNVSISAMARGAGGLASAGIVNGRAEKTLAETMRGQVALACRSVRQRVRYLSGGNQQKVALARCLAADAKVLLLDEPTKGVDVGARAEVYRLIDEAAANGAAVLVVSSYNSELIELCDRILVMARGDIVAEFPRGVTDHELTMAQQGSNYVNN